MSTDETKRKITQNVLYTKPNTLKQTKSNNHVVQLAKGKQNDISMWDLVAKANRYT